MAAPGPPAAVGATRLALALHVAWAPPTDDGTAYAGGGVGSLLSYDVELQGGSGGGGLAATVSAAAGGGGGRGAVRGPAARDGAHPEGEGP
jgi:hypothetical protein